MLKNEQHIGSEKTYGPKKYYTVKHYDAKDAASERRKMEFNHGHCLFCRYSPAS